MSSPRSPGDRSMVEKTTTSDSPNAPPADQPQPSFSSLRDLQMALDELTVAQEQMQRQYERLRMLHQTVEARLRAEIADAGRDIERRVTERTRELEQAAVAKDHFLAMLSHELRTPLMPALLLANALEHQIDLPPDVREDLRVIRRNLELQVALIDDLLDLTRIARGKLSLNLHSTHVHELVRNVVSMLATQMADRQLTLDLNLLATHDAVTADPARIQQVLWNLLGNAIKFTPPGGRISITSQDVSDHLLRITVNDNGIGIDPELLPLVFDAFQQGRQTVGSRAGGLGLGLGLTICRLLVEMHNGTLRAESPGVGAGATFTLELPTITDQPAGRSPVVGSAPQRSLHLLLVDDHEDTVHVLSRVLEQLGHSSQAAHTLAEAAETIETTSFDVVLCDLNLGDGSGLDLIHRIARNHAIPVIAMSGFGATPDVQRTREAGACVHLVKPITVDSLIAALESATALARGES